jgi:predicted dehydrogenase
MPEKINRRTFLRESAVTSAAAGLTVSAGTALSAESASDKVIVGVMGMSRGKALAQGFARQSRCEVKYVCDVDEERAAAAVKAVVDAGGKAPHAIGDFRRILDDNEVDALVCAAPNHWHAPATILACAAGKHVYVEKPCSHNPREGELMVQAARQHKRAVQMGTQRRSSSGIIEGIELVRGGRIGRAYCARSWYTGGRGPTGRCEPAGVPGNIDYELWQGPAPRVPYATNRVHYKWHWFWDWGNGELGNNGVHALDICRWGLDVDYPIRVTSAGGRYVFDDDQQTPDTHAVAFEFDDKKLITWDSLSCNQHKHDFVTFYGEQGSLTIKSGGGYVLADAKGKVVDDVSGTRGDAEHLHGFLAAIRNGTPQVLNAEIEEGHKSTLLCHLGNIAQRTGRTLQCSGNNGHILDDPQAMSLWAREYEPGWEPKV